MKLKKSAQSFHSLKIAYFFVGFVVILICISLIIKLSVLFLNSKFDGRHRFTVAAYTQKSSENVQKSVDIISFAPDTVSISILKVSSDTELFATESGKLLKTPIDGSIFISQIENRPVALSDSNIGIFLESVVLNSRQVKTDMTIIDFVRLYLFTKTVPSHLVTVKKHFLIQDSVDLSSELGMDKISTALFADSSLIAEKLSIKVVNGTGVGGLGNRLARLITNMGGNVVVVATEDSELQESEIQYYGAVSYTLERLQKILGFKISEMKKPGISDIIIRLGKDSLEEQIY